MIFFCCVVGSLASFCLLLFAWAVRVTFFTLIFTLIFTLNIRSSWSPKGGLSTIGIACRRNPPSHTGHPPSSPLVQPRNQTTGTTRVQSPPNQIIPSHQSGPRPSQPPPNTLLSWYCITPHKERPTRGVIPICTHRIAISLLLSLYSRDVMGSAVSSTITCERKADENDANPFHTNEQK